MVQDDRRKNVYTPFQREYIMQIEVICSGCQ